MHRSQAIDSFKRVDEISELKKQDNHSVSGKGNKIRIAYMTDQVYKVLTDWENDKSSEFVFPDRNGYQMKRISNAYLRAVNELKLNAIATRNTFFLKLVFITKSLYKLSDAAISNNRFAKLLSR